MLWYALWNENWKLDQNATRKPKIRVLDIFRPANDDDDPRHDALAVFIRSLVSCFHYNKQTVTACCLLVNFMLVFLEWDSFGRALVVSENCHTAVLFYGAPRIAKHSYRPGRLFFNEHTPVQLQVFVDKHCIVLKECMCLTGRRKNCNIFSATPDDILLVSAWLK